MTRRVPDPTPLPRKIVQYLWRATWLRCPVCGTQPIFTPLRRTRSLRDWFTPLDGCPRDGFPYEREPGYFLLAVWAIGYIAAALFGVALFVYLQVWHSDLPTWVILCLLAASVPLVNVIFARHAKAYFLAIDHLADPFVPPSETDGSLPDADDDGPSDGGSGPEGAPGPGSAPVVAEVEEARETAGRH